MFCYCHFEIKSRATCRPKSRCQSDLSTVSVPANKLASGSDAQRVPWNGGPKCLSTGLFAFPSPLFPSRPKACSQAMYLVAIDVGLFDSSDDEEFLGFRAEDIPLRGEENDANASGESDFSLSEASEDESSEESEDEDADEDAWSRNLRNVLVNNFERDTGPSNILPPEAKADSFLYQMFPEDLIDLIVNETNRNAEQKQRAAGR